MERADDVLTEKPNDVSEITRFKTGVDEILPESKRCNLIHLEKH